MVWQGSLLRVTPGWNQSFSRAVHLTGAWDPLLSSHGFWENLVSYGSKEWGSCFLAGVIQGSLSTTRLNNKRLNSGPYRAAYLLGASNRISLFLQFLSFFSDYQDHPRKSHFLVNSKIFWLGPLNTFVKLLLSHNLRKSWVFTVSD